MNLTRSSLLCSWKIIFFLLKKNRLFLTRYYIRLKMNDNVRYEKDALILIYTYLFFFFSDFPFIFNLAKVATISLIIVISKLSAFLNIFMCDLSWPGYITNFEPILTINHDENTYLESGNYRTVGFFSIRLTISITFCNLTTSVNQDAREFVIKNPRLFAHSRGISTLYCTI